MTTEIVPMALKAEIQTWSLERLKAELAASLVATSQSFIRAAILWGELARRGTDLSDLKRGVGELVMAIANGILAPEAVAAFLGRPGLLRLLNGVPLTRQCELADNAEISVYDPQTKATIRAPIKALDHRCIRRVFQNGQELTVDQQRMVTTVAPKAAPTPSRLYKVYVDRTARTVKVGSTTVTIAEVVSALAIAAGQGGEIDSNLHATTSGETAVARLTTEEKDRLKAAAKAHGVTEPELVRRAILAMLCL